LLGPSARRFACPCWVLLREGFACPCWALLREGFACPCWALLREGFACPCWALLREVFLALAGPFCAKVSLALAGSFCARVCLPVLGSSARRFRFLGAMVCLPLLGPAARWLAFDSETVGRVAALCAGRLPGASLAHAPSRAALQDRPLASCTGQILGGGQQLNARARYALHPARVFVRELSALRALFWEAASNCWPGARRRVNAPRAAASSSPSGTPTCVTQTRAAWACLLPIGVRLLSVSPRGAFPLASQFPYWLSLQELSDAASERMQRQSYRARCKCRWLSNRGGDGSIFFKDLQITKWFSKNSDFRRCRRRERHRVRCLERSRLRFFYTQGR
jgi:hypothetical protein